MVGQGLLGELDVGEADHRMGPRPSGQAERAGEGDERALVVVLTAPRGVVDPADMGEGVDGLMEQGLQAGTGQVRTYAYRLRGGASATSPAIAREANRVRNGAR
jgi:hypothetical protein